MRLLLFLFAILLGWPQGNCAQVAGPPAEQPVGLTLAGMYYPADAFGSQNNHVQLLWQVNPELSAAIELFHDTYGAGMERIRFEGVARGYFAENWYLMGGVEWEMEANPNALVRGVRVGGLLGIGYRPNSLMVIEAGFTQPIVDSPVGSFGTVTKKQTGFLRSRIRF